METTQKQNQVKAMREELQQIHQSQHASQQRKLADFKPATETGSNDVTSPPDGSVVEEFESSAVQYASLADAIASSSQPSTRRGGQDELLDKLDKILFLLEEQRDQKTGHVTEELILYSFIGIFIIFVLDSFARAGKYVR